MHLQLARLLSLRTQAGSRGRLPRWLKFDAEKTAPPSARAHPLDHPEKRFRRAGGASDAPGSGGAVTPAERPLAGMGE
eukprot:8126078-Alexandrium_andersonii.AAC.1